MTRSDRIRALQLALRAAIAAGASLAAARVLGLPVPLYAMIAAVIVTDLSPAETRRLSLPRLAGTVVGAGLGAVLSAAFGDTGAFAPLAVALGVFVAMLVSQWAGWPAASKLSGYLCGLVLLDHASDPWAYGLFRLLETGLGIAAAVLVSFVPKLLSAEEPAAPAA